MTTSYLLISGICVKFPLCMASFHISMHYYSLQDIILVSNLFVMAIVKDNIFVNDQLPLKL